MNEFVTNLSFKPDEDYAAGVFFDDLKKPASKTDVILIANPFVYCNYIFIRTKLEIRLNDRREKF